MNCTRNLKPCNTLSFWVGLPGHWMPKQCQQTRPKNHHVDFTSNWLLLFQKLAFKCLINHNRPSWRTNQSSPMWLGMPSWHWSNCTSLGPLSNWPPWSLEPKQKPSSTGTVPSTCYEVLVTFTELIAMCSKEAMSAKGECPTNQLRDFCSDCLQVSETTVQSSDRFLVSDSEPKFDLPNLNSSCLLLVTVWLSYGA